MNAVAQQAQLQGLTIAMSFVTDWSVAIDGGAYVGNWTTEMARHFKVVHAFEPSARDADAMRKRFARTQNVRVHESALWSEAGKVNLLPDPEHPNKDFGRYVQPGGHIDAVAIDSMGLPACGLIKLDLEGAEMPALRGARETIKRCHPVVICECKPRMAARYNATVDDPNLFLTEFGYREVARHKPDRIFMWTPS